MFNIDKQFVYVYWHYTEGQIYRKAMEIPVNKLVAQDNVNDKEGMGDAGSEESQFFKLINEMEQKCQSQIKASEEQAYTERLNRKTAERKILQ